MAPDLGRASYQSGMRVSNVLRRGAMQVGGIAKFAESSCTSTCRSCLKEARRRAVRVLIVPLVQRERSLGDMDVDSAGIVCQALVAQDAA